MVNIRDKDKYQVESYYIHQHKVSPYDLGFKFCSRCNFFVMSDSFHCPDCGKKMRVQSGTSRANKEFKRIGEIGDS